ncbi:MAG: aminotransferase class V-fold PLP-dependent enzyme [Hyphomonas sp.]|uniref:aminotransferase class V-fold PLP-dependent enzyme n=1 Tax=Hyphomonas sp. TaxID=87 RepID=UPI0034A08077
MNPVPNSRAEALQRDAADPLAQRRALFDLPEGVTYLVGHSLGPPPKGARERMAAAQADWAQGLVRSWNTAGWIDLAERTGDRLAALIGAEPGEVIVADSVSVNLFKLAAAALAQARTYALFVEEDEFPTDQYIAAGLGGLSGAEVRRLPAGGTFEALKAGGVVIRSAVNYRSAEVADIAAHEREAKRHGARIVWDLSHATGVLDLKLGADGAELAAGCTYKYLNGGPGAPAFVYVSNALAPKLANPLPGWMGHAAPFAFDANYAPRGGAARFASGTPPILSLAALSGALEALEGADLAQVQAKARALGALALARAQAMGLDALSPLGDARRGGHVSLRIPEGYPVVQALAARGVMADFRAPDTVRFGFSPLFLTYTGVWDAADALAEILASKSWDQPQFHARAKVT